MRRLIFAVLLLLVPDHAHAIKVGEKAPDFALTDVFGKAYSLASFTRPVLAVWYEGKASLEQNKWLKEQISELRKQGRLNDENYDGIGIANYQETAIPNALIDIFIKKEARTNKVRVLSDRDGRMRRIWGFRNGRSNVYLFDAQRRLVWRSSGPLTKVRAKQYLRLLLRMTRKR
ncbi:MAG: hypothetical protein RBU30_10970 [Polyangia bacterium]|jgi:predicted transcriptional regulator|nr:hypothetical protein [Polyangia bacterium]